jgi:hypothetical protein
MGSASTAMDTLRGQVAQAERAGAQIDEIDMCVAMLAVAVGPAVVAEYLRALADEVEALPDICDSHM